MKQKVVVIGHGYTSRLGIIRSLAELDCEITVIAMVFHNWIGRFIRFDWGKPIDCYSKYVNQMFYCYARDGEGLINLLLLKCTDPEQKVIIIPDSDYSAMVIDNNQNRLKDYFLFPNIYHTPGLVEHWMDKSVQKDLAKSVGMNVASAKEVRIMNSKYEMPKVTFPCFTKPLATINGGKQFLKKCNDELELKRVLDSVASVEPDIDILIEDYKAIAKEYAVLGFSDGKEVVIPGIIEFIANSKSHFGIAREGKVIPVTGFEVIIDHFKSLVQHVGLCGLFDIDFYECDGDLYFGELNLRFGGSGYSITKMGVNLPVMLVKSLLGESLEGMNKMISGTAHYSNERMCIDDWSYGYISKEECLHMILSADIHFILDEEDLAPQKKLNAFVVLQGMKRIMRKIKNKCR